MTRSENDESQIDKPAQKGLKILSKLLRVALPLGVIAAGCFAYSILSVQIEKAKTPPAPKQEIRTRVTELKVQDYSVVIRTHGIVQAHNEVTLSSQVAGQITKISPQFEVGSYFSTGDVLVEVDARDYVTAVAIAKAQHEGAKAALELAKQDHERAIELFDKEVVSVSKAEVSLAAATRAQAESTLDSTEAQLEQAERDLERTKILASFDGRVRQKTVGLGQTVSIGTSLGVVFAIDYAEVRLPISGRELQYLDLPELAGDAPVDVELRDAINEESVAVWNAKLIRTEGTLDENSLELYAIARVDDPFGQKSGDPPLRIGQPVVGTITGSTLTDVIVMPRIAVRQLDQVFLVDKTDHTLMPMTIVPVWSDEENVIVRDPLIADGALLSTTNIVYAPAGAKVEIIPEIEITASATDAAEEVKTDTKPVAN